jgi:Undecaprenyl-phosphate galactose phosphotransferase WbaP
MFGVRVKGVFVGEHRHSWNPDWPPVLGHMATASKTLYPGFAQYAIVTTSGTNLEIHHAIQDYCRGFHRILLMMDMHGLCSMGASAREVGGEIGLEVPQRLFHRGSAFAKRVLDSTAALIVLIVVSPLLLALAAAVKLTSRGPVFFAHQRLGRDGRAFKALKFRTMVIDGKRVMREWLKAHPECGEEWERDHKLKFDPRVTGLGRLLRRFSLDELPQLLNVMAGQMSLVGPRPIVTEEIEKYGRSYDLYKRVLPGITGLWQVSGRNNVTYEERVRFDEYYVRNWSVWLDVYILVRTVGTVLSGDGAY